MSKRMGKVLRLAGLTIIVTLLSACSAGPDGSPVALAAKLLWGLVDGQKLMIYGIGMGQVRQLDVSTFEFVMPSGKVTYSLSEPSPCHVDTVMQVSSKYGKIPGTTVSADFTKVTQIDVQDETTGSGADIGEKVGLNVVWVKFGGGDFVKPSLPVGYLFTSLAAADYQAAAAELQRIC